MPRLDLKELRIYRKRLAEFVIVDSHRNDEFTRIETAERRVIGLNANNAAPRRMVERHNSDRTHRGHHPGASARDEISNIASRAFTDHTWSDDDHRAEVSETRREAKKLIAALQN